jgi:hypothetical protein
MRLSIFLLCLSAIPSLMHADSISLSPFPDTTDFAKDATLSFEHGDLRPTQLAFGDPSIILMKTASGESKLSELPANRNSVTTQFDLSPIILEAFDSTSWGFSHPELYNALILQRIDAALKIHPGSLFLNRTKAALNRHFTLLIPDWNGDFETPREVHIWQ